MTAEHDGPQPPAEWAQPADPVTRPTSNRRGPFFAAVGCIVALVGLGAVLPVPYVRLAPGPVFDTLGSYDGKPLITITGTKTYPTTGQLDMTTVSEQDGQAGSLTLLSAVLSWFNKSYAVLPRDLIYPPNQTPEQNQQQNAEEMTTSQSDATIAAVNFLGIHYSTRVAVGSIVVGAPALGKLQAGDLITAVNGTAITTAQQVGTLVRASPVGTKLTFKVTRQKALTTVDATSAANPKDGTPYLGITVTDLPDLPFQVTFTLDQVGGPSAGLMFSLGIIDKLDQTEMARGRHIAGTGTIDPSGNVGPIGGIIQKMAGARRDGATIFLVPKDNCAEALTAVPEGLTVVRADSMSAAVGALRAPDGAALPTCPTS